MKRLHLVFVFATLFVASLVGCKSSNNDTLYSSYKPYTRWWWFSSDINIDDVRDQLIWLKDHDFGGVEIAWIYPMFLDSNTSHPAFLSPEWAKPVNAAKHIADSLGLGCEYTFGTLWPFNSVDLPDGDQTRTYFDSVAVARSRFSWDFPKEGRVLNHLDSAAFYRYADKMNAALSEAYKGNRAGVFVDSWEVETEYLWTPGFEKTFMEEHGYDIEPYFKDTTLYNPENIDVRYDYMSTLSGYVMREFYTPFTNNAHKNNAFARSQCAGAPSDLLTTYTLVDVPETEAILYEPSFSKIVASAAALGDKQAVSSETFTCAYGWTGLLYKKGHGHSPHQGKEQIADLKLICDAIFANGTNQIFWHGFPFNKVGDTSNFFYTTCQISTCDLNNLTGSQLKDFNRYMATVSEYMRKGKTHSQLAVYMPLEDAWMSGKYPDSIRSFMPWALGQYELRYIRTPEVLKGMAPLWVNQHFLKDATYKNGTLHCGATNFTALYSEVQYMEYGALQHILRLAKAGMPVCITVLPQEPGMNKHEDYTALLDQLISLPNVSTDIANFDVKPMLEGDNLPDFWCRKDGDTYYLFAANPMCQHIRYPLKYGNAFTDKGSIINATINHHGKSEDITLKFNPNESILLKITKEGVQTIDLGYVPPRLPGMEE